MDRVHQGTAGPVLLIEPFKVVAGNLKGGDTSGRILDPDSRQVSAVTEQEGPDEDVCCLVVLDGDHLL
jgi:hypothetical protein